MPLPRPSSFRRALRWLVPAAALALAPKCLLCVLAYAGLASALGLGGHELCGAPTEPVSLARDLALCIGIIVTTVAAVLLPRFLRRAHHEDTVAPESPSTSPLP